MPGLTTGKVEYSTFPAHNRELLEHSLLTITDHTALRVRYDDDVNPRLTSSLGPLLSSPVPFYVKQHGFRVNVRYALLVIRYSRRIRTKLPRTIQAGNLRMRIHPVNQVNRSSIFMNARDRVSCVRSGLPHHHMNVIEQV